MRDAIIIFIAIIVSMAVGSYLFLTDSPKLPTSLPGGQNQTDAYLVLQEGAYAESIDRRVNYRIMTEEEYAALWDLIYGRNAPARPSVDFTTHEIIAVFDGSHSTDGYRVAVADITDDAGVRTVRIVREAPGEGCVTAQQITSPFQLVLVSKTPLPLERAEETVTHDCQ